MKKIFTKRLFIYMLAAFLITIAAIFTLQTFTNQRENISASKAKLADVKEKLAGNEENIRNLKENLSEENLAKARAFADMLAADKSINGNISKLEKIKDRLMISELNIIDENGIIIQSTVDEYIGFDMGSGEQSAAFLEIIKNPSMEIVQEPTVNAAAGIVTQYIGVARKDAPGVVQVGIRPEVLENMLAGTQIHIVLRGVEFGEHGYVYAVDTQSGDILAHPDEDLIGTLAQEAGIPLKAGKGTANINGTSGKYVAQEYNGMYIGTFVSLAEYYHDPFIQTLVMAFSIFLIFVVLLFFINNMIERKIVNGIQNITLSVKKISDGDFGITIDERGTPEFSVLSDSVNKMVGSICESMRENEELIGRQKEDMENNLNLIENIKMVCSNLDGVSQETLSTADAINNGTSEQEQAVRDLEHVMDNLVQELNRSAGVSQNAADAALAAAGTIKTTGMQMKTLEEAIEKISAMSAQIEEIIGEINSIAHQTNMLSLNASIEAARVGENGKGFAVVATQVGDLAARSAQAAKQTSELITNSINAVEEGKVITKRTAEEFAAVVKEIEKASQSVYKITDMVKQNVETVSHAVEGLDVIANVVQKNVQISQNSKEVSMHMADEAGKLLDLVE